MRHPLCRLAILIFTRSLLTVVATLWAGSPWVSVSLTANLRGVGYLVFTEPRGWVFIRNTDGYVVNRVLDESAESGQGFDFALIVK